MTYGVERMTLGGNTLYDKLHAQFGERAARSVGLGLEANAKKAARANAASARTATASVPRANSRPIPQSAPQAAGRPVRGAHTRSRNRAHAHDRVLSEPRASRIATPEEAYALRNPYRARINYMKRPVTGKSDLEISIATFPQAYRAGMRAKRAMGRGIVRDTSAYGARVRYGLRPGETKDEYSALDKSRRVMSSAYVRGERMRRLTDIENAKPTPKDAKGIEVPTGIEKFILRARAVFLGKSKHSTEVRVKRSPFPIGTLALITVCTIVLLFMISSFAELSDTRNQISDLEYTHSSLEVERARLSGLVENREDIRVIEKIATEELGMVSAELAKGRFVSLSDYDSVEIVDVEPEKEEGVLSSVFSSISENLGKISDYFN